MLQPAPEVREAVSEEARIPPMLEVDGAWCPDRGVCPAGILRGEAVHPSDIMQEVVLNSLRGGGGEAPEKQSVVEGERFQR